jgi:hypothetical protein
MTEANTPESCDCPEQKTTGINSVPLVNPERALTRPCSAHHSLAGSPEQFELIRRGNVKNFFSLTLSTCWPRFRDELESPARFNRLFTRRVSPNRKYL